LTSSFDTSILGLASKLINKFGSTIVITTVTAGTYDPATSTQTGGSSVNTTLKGVIEEYAESIRFLGDKLQANSSIIEGDKKITIAAQDVAAKPNVGDKCQALGVQYTILGVASQQSTEATALYVLHVRKN
jgi:hypothetical protein